MQGWKYQLLFFLCFLHWQQGGPSVPESQLEISRLKSFRLTLDWAEIRGAKLTAFSALLPPLSGLPFSFHLRSQQARITQVSSELPSTPFFSLSHVRFPLLPFLLCFSTYNEYAMLSDPVTLQDKEALFFQAGVFVLEVVLIQVKVFVAWIYQLLRVARITFKK